MNVSIRNLKEYKDSGWEWDVFSEYSSSHYHTNEIGNGLWICGNYEGKWADNYQDKQIEGTGQFTLPKGKKAAYSKIRRYFTPTEEY